MNQIDTQQMQAEVFEVNTANSWFEDDRSFDEGIALIHSEIAEMLEAYRDHGLDDATVGEPIALDDGTQTAIPKPEGVGSEAADVWIRLLDEAHRQGVQFAPLPEWGLDRDLTFGAHVARLHLHVAKWHERVLGVFGQPEVERRLHTAGLTLVASVLVALCDHYDIDLKSEYTRKIAFNRTRGPKHGGKRL